MFVPSDSFWSEKFAFIENLEDAVNSYIVLGETFLSVFDKYGKYNPETGSWGSSAEVAGPPDFTITLWGAEVTVVNWDVISPYLVTVQSIVVFISYAWFIYWVIRRVVAVIYHE